VRFFSFVFTSFAHRPLCLLACSLSLAIVVYDSLALSLCLPVLSPVRFAVQSPLFDVGAPAAFVFFFALRRLFRISFVSPIPP
jgi:hypothetical protein